MENPAKNLQKRGKKMGQGSKKPDQENTVQQESFVIPFSLGIDFECLQGPSLGDFWK